MNEPGERTGLAWRRTALSCAALGIALARLGALAGSFPQLVAAGSALVAAVVLAAVPAVRRGREQWHPVPPVVVAAAAAGVVVTGVLAVAGAIPT